MARARLRDRHQENLRRKLEVLKAEQAVTLPVSSEIADYIEQASVTSSKIEHDVKQEEPGPSGTYQDDNTDNEM